MGEFADPCRYLDVMAPIRSKTGRHVYVVKGLHCTLTFFEGTCTVDVWPDRVGIAGWNTACKYVL